jgi:hypothetical protein
MVVLGVLVEGGVLVQIHRLTGRGVAPSSLLPTLGAGFFLLLALRLALSPHGWMPLCAALLAALLCHIRDLQQRWKTPPPAKS